MIKNQTPEVESARPRGRPRKTWLEVVRNDMKELGLASVDALDLFSYYLSRILVQLVNPGNVTTNLDPSPSQLVERCKLPHQGLGQSPSRHEFLSILD